MRETRRHIFAWGVAGGGVEASASHERHQTEDFTRASRCMRMRSRTCRDTLFRKATAARTKLLASPAPTHTPTPTPTPKIHTTCVGHTRNFVHSVPSLSTLPSLFPPLPPHVTPPFCPPSERCPPTLVCIRPPTQAPSHARCWFTLTHTASRWLGAVCVHVCHVLPVCQRQCRNVCA